VSKRGRVSIIRAVFEIVWVHLCAEIFTEKFEGVLGFEPRAIRVSLDARGEPLGHAASTARQWKILDYILTIDGNNSFRYSLQVARHALVLPEILLVHCSDVHRHIEFVFAALLLRHVQDVLPCVQRYHPHYTSIETCLLASMNRQPN
jgi:hypothetical protein